VAGDCFLKLARCQESQDASVFAQSPQCRCTCKLPADTCISLALKDLICSCRTFRIIRAFGRFKRLRILVTAIAESLLPVAQASVIVFVVVAIYSTLGVNMFRHKSEGFKDFVHAYHFLFSFIALGEWDSEVLWPFDEDDRIDPLIILYTYSYVCVVLLVLVQVQS